MSEPAGLRRVLGYRDVVLFFIVAIVGLRWIATAAAIGPGALVLWVLALVAFFLPLALCVLDLAARYPDEGGIYVWVKHAFGDFTGFLAAWMYWVSNLVYMPGLLYFGAGNALFALGAERRALENSPTYFIAFSLAGLALALIVNLFGLGIGKWLSNAGAMSTWVPVVVLTAAGGVAWARFGSATPFSPAALWPHPSLSTAVLWSTIAFAFAGLETVPLMGGEVRDPRRTLPRAVIVAGVAIAAIYLLGTLAVLVALPAGEVSGLAGILQAVDRTAARVGWSGLSPLVALMVAFGAIGGTSAWLAATARLPFVAGIDHYLPDAFGRLHPRWGTPYVSLLVQAAGAAIFVVLGQAGAGVREAYDAMVAIGVLTYFLPYLAMFAAWIRLRREPGAPARAPWLVPTAAGLGLLTTAASLVLAVLPPVHSPHAMWNVLKVTGGSLVMVLIGCGIYASGRRRASGR